MNQFVIGVLNSERFMLNELKKPNDMVMMFIWMKFFAKLTVTEFICGELLIKDGQTIDVVKPVR